MSTNVLTTLIERQTAKYGQRAAYAYQKDGEWAEESWVEMAEKVKAQACALQMLGIEECQMVAVYSPNRREVILSDFAAFANRAVPVSIYSTSSPDQVKYILNDSQAKLIYVGEQAQYDSVLAVAKECPALQHIVVLDGAVNTENCPVHALTYDALLRMGREADETVRKAVEARTARSTETDIATLLYTSGTTGDPKGAILTHGCFDAALEAHHRRLPSVSDKDTSMCFLPLSHIFEKAWTFFCLDMGMKVYINTDPHNIQNSLRDVHPTCMCSVPRFWEKVYTGIQDKVGKMGWMKKMLVKRALKVGYRRNMDYVRLGKKAPWLLEKQYEWFDKKIFGPVRRVVGVDRGNIFPTAGAPLSVGIVEFMHSIGINILIGYGLSETTATVTCYPETGWIPGSVGTKMPEVEVRIGEENEIQIKGPTVTRGYFNKEKETEQAFTADGWFRTGDAGYFDAEGQLVLTERIKDLFKTSNGKYIAPQMLESRLGEDKFIEQVAVIGDRRKYVTAIIIPAFEALKEYARRKKIEFKTNADLIRNADIKKMIEARIEQMQADRAGFEKIKKFTLLPHEFTIENGELTNTLKLRRPVINRHYAEQIEAMYA